LFGIFLGPVRQKHQQTINETRVKVVEGLQCDWARGQAAAVALTLMSGTVAVVSPSQSQRPSGPKFKFNCNTHHQRTLNAAT